MPDQQKYNKLDGTRILVIGGTSGIGYAAAEASLESGATVYVSSSNQSRVDDAVHRLQTAYPSKKSQISGVTCNLASATETEENIVRLLKSVTSDGKLDHVIHTAGDGLAVKKLSDIDIPMLQQAGMVRFFSTLILGKHAPAYMNPGPKSSITLTTGTASEKPIAGWSAIVGYATGLHGVTRGLALDLAPLRVNLISPGAVDTELWDSFGLSGPSKDKMFAELEKSLPTGKVAEPNYIAEAYLYVMKDVNITASVISSNGGSLISSK